MTDAYKYFAALSLSNLVTTDELLMLMTAYSADHLLQEKPHEKFDHFDLDNYDDTQCKALFRFEKDALVDLCELMALP